MIHFPLLEKKLLDVWTSFDPSRPVSSHSVISTHAFTLTHFCSSAELLFVLFFNLNFVETLSRETLQPAADTCGHTWKYLLVVSGEVKSGTSESSDKE